MIRFLARLKIYAARSLGYLSFIQGAMVLDVWMKSKGLPHAWYWPALALAILAVLAFGFLEDLSGLYASELEQQWERIPQIRALAKAFDESENYDI